MIYLAKCLALLSDLDDGTNKACITMFSDESGEVEQYGRYVCSWDAIADMKPALLSALAGRQLTPDEKRLTLFDGFDG